MKGLKIGDKFQIQCYKHDGNVHKSWNQAVLLDIKKDYLVFGNEKALVTKAQGVAWKTKEPAIMYFFPNRWYNIIAQLKKDGTTFYCNIASPYIIEEQTIKYIDYDLDLRIFANGSFKILDRGEYKFHKKKMSYPKELDVIIQKSLSELIDYYQNGEIVFDKQENLKYEKKFHKIKGY